jgi:hypothetical protein
MSQTDLHAAFDPNHDPSIPAVSIVIDGVVATGFCAAIMTGTNTAASTAGSAGRAAPPCARQRVISCRHATSDTTAPGANDSATIRPLSALLHRRRRPTTVSLDAPSRRGSVNYMVDHIREPMPSTGSHLPNYAARCKMLMSAVKGLAARDRPLQRAARKR